MVRLDAVTRELLVDVKHGRMRVGGEEQTMACSLAVWSRAWRKRSYWGRRPCRACMFLGVGTGDHGVW